MKRGYIAITTSIILSILILAVAVSLGSSNLFIRFDTLDFYNKQSSFSAARSCLDYGLLKLADNPSYLGNETISISSYQCSILTVETSGPNKILKARSQISGATTNLKLTVNAQNLSTVALEEVVSF